MQPISLDLAALPLNLSHVLREPSTSRTVHRAVRESRRFARRRKHLLESLGAAAVKDVAIPPSLRERAAEIGPAGAIVTVSVGLPEKLCDLVPALWPEIEIIEPIVVDAMHADSIGETRSLFGQPASVPGLDTTGSDSVVLVTAAIVRPADTGLMLGGGIVATKDDELGEIERIIEALIRDYVDQWTPGRQLWRAPIEELDSSVLNHARTDELIRE